MDQLKETVVGAFHLDVSVHFYTDVVLLLMGTVWLLGDRRGALSFGKLGFAQILHGHSAAELSLY